jgi:hypothetical protein
MKALALGLVVMSSLLHTADGYPDKNSSDDYVKGWCDGFSKAHKLADEARNTFAEIMKDKIGGQEAIDAVDLYLILTPKTNGVNVILDHGKLYPCNG